jgi:hypothetical protein
MKTRISGFGPKWRQMRWVLVTARGYENLRMEFAVNVHDLVRSCLLTIEPAKGVGSILSLSPNASSRPANASLFLPGQTKL